MTQQGPLLSAPLTTLWRLVGLFGLTAVLAACDGGAPQTPVNEAPDAEIAAASENTDPLADTGVDVESDLYSGDIVYGDTSAPIEIIEYASMTCPHCANFAATIYPKIEKDYVDTGKVKFVFRNLISNQLDLAATVGARCGGVAPAGALIKDLFYRQIEWARSDEPVDAIAQVIRKAGISRAQFDRCLKDVPIQRELIEVTQDALKNQGVTGTPTVFVDGKKLENYAFETIEEAIKKNL